MSDYFAALWEIWWALMGSGAFTILSIVAALRNNSNKIIIHGSWIVALVFFFYASYSAWQKEHLKVVDLTDTKFELSIIQAGIGDIPQGVQIQMWVSLDNLGPPSAIAPAAWKLILETKDKNHYQGSPEPFAVEQRDFCIGNTNMARRFVRSDSLDSKASQTLGSPSHTEGVLLFNFRNVSKNLIDKQTKLSIRFSDLRGKSFLFEETIGEIDSHTGESVFTAMTYPFNVNSSECPNNVTR